MPIPKFQVRSNNRRSVFLALGTALILAACVVGNLYLSRTYHLAVVQDGVLYRDGNRGLREFSTAVRRVRPKVVVSLIDDGELGDPNKPQFAQEADFLSTHGIRQVRIPVKLGGWPSSDDIANSWRSPKIRKIARCWSIVPRGSAARVCLWRPIRNRP